MTRCTTSQRLRAMAATRAGMLSVMFHENNTAKSAARRRSPMKRQYGDSPSYRERGESPAKRDGTSSRRERRSSMVLGKEVETEFDGWNPECPG